MAVNKNFVVKNGLEVNTNLLLADADNSRVGVGTSVPSFTLHVFGGIGVTDVSVTGVTTLSSDLRLDQVELDLLLQQIHQQVLVNLLVFALDSLNIH